MIPHRLTLAGARPFSDSCLSRTITAAGTESVTVPTGAKAVVITASAAASVRPGAAPTAFGDVTDGTAGEMITPGEAKAFELNGETEIHARAGAADATVNFAFYGGA